MALKDHDMPQGAGFAKLIEYPDGEEIRVIGAGIKTGGKYGDQPYFTSFDGEMIILPGRYLDYVKELLADREAVNEMSGGKAWIRKGSYEYRPGSYTPTFTWI